MLFANFRFHHVTTDCFEIYKKKYKKGKKSIRLPFIYSHKIGAFGIQVAVLNADTDCWIRVPSK